MKIMFRRRMKKCRKNRQNQMKRLNLIMPLKAAKATTQKGKRKKSPSNTFKLT